MILSHPKKPTTPRGKYQEFEILRTTEKHQGTLLSMPQQKVPPDKIEMGEKKKGFCVCIGPKAQEKVWVIRNDSVVSKFYSS